MLIPQSTSGSYSQERHNEMGHVKLLFPATRVSLIIGHMQKGRQRSFDVNDPAASSSIPGLSQEGWL